MLDPTETRVMEGVGKVTDLKLIILPSSSFELQFTTQLINRCELKLKTDVHAPYLSHPHPIAAAESPPPPCHVLAALFRSIHFCTHCGYNLSEAKS